MAFKQLLSSNLCQEIQKPEVLLQKKSVFEDGCYDSLPTVNNSSKYLFDVGSFSDAYQYEEDINVFTFPNGNYSFASKDWFHIEVRKIKEANNLVNADYHETFNLIKTKIDSHTSFILKSFAPYGYEYERDFYDAVDYSIPENKQEMIYKYNAKFINHKFYINNVRENDKAIYETDFFIRVTYIKETNTLHSTLIKKTARKVTFWKESKNLIQQKGLNLKLNFEDIYLSPRFRELLTKYSSTNHPQIHPLLGGNHRFSYWRKVFKNQFWTDIHSQYACDYLKSNHEKYSSVMYHYKKYGTKKARQVLYQTTNKALMRKYEELDTAIIPEAILATKLLLSNGVTIEKCLWYLTQSTLSLKDKPAYVKRSSNLYSDTFINYLYAVQEHYPMITFDKLLKIEAREASVEVRDIALTLQRIESIKANTNEAFDVTLPEFTDIHSLHTLSTRLSHILNMYRNKEDFIPFGHLKEMEEKYNFEDENFIYKAASSPAELRECGNELSICVGSYGSRAKSRNCDIIFVRQKDKPEVHFGCIEVSNTNQLRQVKLRRNERGSNNEELNASVLLWAEGREINPEHCYDISLPEKLKANDPTERLEVPLHRGQGLGYVDLEGLF